MPIDRVVIAGGGVAGWLAASLLARRLHNTGITIHLVEGDGGDDSLGIPGDAELILPRTLEASDLMGEMAGMLLAGGHAGFGLGTALSGWSADGAANFIGFGDIGAPIGAVAFHQLAARLRNEGRSINLANYALAALCAQSGRFAVPPPGDRSVHGSLGFGVHVDAAAFAAAMRRDALQHGVGVSIGTVRGVEYDDDGLLAAVVIESGDRIAGDLFIDASGPGSVLAGAFEDWSQWLPCDRAAGVRRANNDAPPLYRHLGAHGAGWQGFMALPGGVAEQFVYHSGSLTAGPDGVHFRSGRRTAPWQNNCLAIGGAAAVMDPVTGCQLHLAQSAIMRLIALFPHDRAARTESAEYNRQTIAELECARDFAILHYKCNARHGDPFWDACRAMPVPAALAHKIALFESCGRVALGDGEVFEEGNWVGLFDALGLRPRRHDVLAGGIGIDQIEAHFGRIRAVMLQAVAAMPPHAATLAAFGNAAA